MSEEGPDIDSGRRDFLKRSLVTSAVLWSAPVVTSLPGGKAWAQTYESCTCGAEAYGLFVSIPLLGVSQYFGEDTCVANANVGNNTVARVRATTICGADFDSVDAGCSAEATIATLNVRVGPLAVPTLTVAANVLLTTASAACAPCGTIAGFSLASLTVGGTLVGGPINVNVNAACNLDVAGLGLVIVNEQTCNGPTRSVNALHITVPGIIEVIAAHSEAGATGCPCTTC